MNSERNHKDSLPSNYVSNETSTVYKSQFVGLDDKPYATKCLLCNVKFVLPQNEEDLLIHLFEVHRLVIGDVWKIASLKSYIHYWSVKFEKEPVTTFCTTVLMNCTPDGKPSENERYFLLSDCISEDKTLRDEIHRAKLEWVLAMQTKERTDTNFKRGCIFCRMEFSGLRINYVKHLAQKHNLYLGKPDNLVFIDEFLDKIQTTIENLVCIYCEKLFKDRTVLKEHMRKKLHKRINPNNKEYDKFYINNYLEPGKSWRHKQIHFNQTKTEDQSSENEDEDTWSDWDDDEGVNISCLFCNYNEKHFHLVLEHMKTDHDFDFKVASNDLTFYQKVKVVNYVRRQIYLKQCIFCEAKVNDVLEHMKEQSHFKIPTQKTWDQPEFYFPMCENDSFLYNLDSNDSNDEESDVENLTRSVCEMSKRKLRHTMMQNKVKSELFKTDCCSSFFEDDCIKIKIVGIINTSTFQKARICAEKLYQHMPFKFTLPQIVEIFQIDWHEYIEKMKRQIGGKMWSLTRTVAVFINDEFIGSDLEFFHYISEDYIISLPFGIGYYENIAIERCKRFMEKSKRIYVYFTFTINDRIIGSFVFMLYSDLLPLTCQHFLNLCNGFDEVNRCYREAYYINTRVHRIVKNGWIQCGGIEFPEIGEDRAANVVVIPDESYCIPHDRRGVLSMANDGKHCNQSQFVVCLKPNPWMNHYYVAFGQLIDGARTLKILENISTYYENPVKQVLISQCGEYCFDDEPKMEARSQVFLKHEPASVEGEATAITDNIFDFYSITPWLNNIVDVIDARDTASILMVERYLNGLYCLSSDYVPGMDMRIHEKMDSISMPKYDTTTAKLCQLLMHFQPDKMTEPEKGMFISDISEIILAYMFHHEYNEFCLRHISMDTHTTVHKILEIAHQIAQKVVEKAERRALIRREYGDLNITKMFEACTQDILPSENCMSLLQEILNKAILCLIQTEMIDRQE